MNRRERDRQRQRQRCTQRRRAHLLGVLCYSVPPGFRSTQRAAHSTGWAGVPPPAPRISLAHHLARPDAFVYEVLVCSKKKKTGENKKSMGRSDLHAWLVGGARAARASCSACLLFAQSSIDARPNSRRHTHCLGLSLASPAWQPSNPDVSGPW